MKVFVLSVLTVALLYTYQVGLAQVRSSNSYQLQSDSINLGGGYGTSTSFIQESTVGEVGTGVSDSNSYSLRAGYQQMQEVYLSLAISDSTVTLAPSIPGITGGTSYGSTTITAVSDSPSGYQLSINASDSPAMNNNLGDFINDYAPVLAAPDRLFITDATDSQFGYSPFGDHVVSRFLDDGALCDNGGTNNTQEECWDGLTTTPTVIALSSSPNQPAGTDTTIYFSVGVGGSVGQAPGTYVATTTVTLLAL